MSFRVLMIYLCLTWSKWSNIYLRLCIIMYVFVLFSHSDFTTSRIIRTKSRQFLARHPWRVASPSSTSNGEWKKEKILDTGGFLTSSKKRSGKTFPDAKIYNQARSPTISCLTWPHRCPGKYLLKLVYTTMGWRSEKKIAID